jgi:hypothetical protein
MGASDGARAVVEALIAEGMPITLWQLSESVSLEGDPRLTGPFSRRVLEETQCDYLLPIDADEFVVANDREHLERALAALPPGAHALANWSTYVPVQGDDPAEPRVLARIQHRRKSEKHPYAKVFVNRSLLGEPGASIAVGQHSVEGAQSPTVTLAEISLAHFPVRSLLQIQSKALLGTSALLMGGGEQLQLGYQWQLAYRRLFENTETDLRGLAANYLGENEADWDAPEFLVHDPLPPVRRAYEPQQPGILELAAGLSFKIGSAYGKLRNTIMPPPINPEPQWPNYEGATGAFDAVRVTEARIDVQGWIELPEGDRPAQGVAAIFPGKKISLECRHAFPERATFKGAIALDDFEGGIYTLRIFALGASGRWFLHPQNVMFEKQQALRTPQSTLPS